MPVSYGPHGVEWQSFGDGTLEHIDGRGAGSADEVHALGGEAWDGFGEDAVVPAREQSDAVGTDECAAVLLAGLEDALLEGCSLGGLLAEAGRDNNERAHALLAREEVDVVGTVAGCHDEDGEVGGRQLAHIVEGSHALHLVFLGIHDAQRAAEVAAQDVAHNGASGLVDIVRAADDDDALGLEKLLVYHAFCG